MAEELLSSLCVTKVNIFFLNASTLSLHTAIKAIFPPFCFLSLTYNLFGKLWLLYIFIKYCPSDTDLYECPRQNVHSSDYLKAAKSHWVYIDVAC